MKTTLRFSVFIVLAMWAAVGCSALPGLRVLTGEDSPDAVANQVVEITDLVMADKSGLTDPALIAAADRIEAATSSNVDIIEIRKDLAADVFTVYMLITLPNEDASQAEFLNQVRRDVELTWQGTLRESEGSDVLKIVVLLPNIIPTLDKGSSFVGVVWLNSEIARSDALAYLANRPNNLNQFVDLIAQGVMTLEEATESELYDGQPNHPVFMLGSIVEQIQQSQ
ncbi:MAG: hypothetical protein K8L97_28105 [Anaerolineae bacterium]|nr:hypothetical protein [Anaerolineae bacterium]